MNTNSRDCFKASGIWLGMGFVLTIISVAIDTFGLFLLALLFFLFSVFCLLGGIVYLIKDITKTAKPKDNKIKYSQKDSAEFIKQAGIITKDYEERIQKEQQKQDVNRKECQNLHTELDGKKQLKKQYDNVINEFLKENVFKVGRVSINMIQGTVEYYTTTIKLEDITDIQVKCNSQVITKSNTSEQRQAKRGLVSTVGRAAVGTVAFGPAGAVLGLTGKKKTKGSSSTTTTQTQVDNYSVIILTSNIQNSVITIPCGHNEAEALRVSNSINNAAINIGTVDTEEHGKNVDESNKLGLEIKDLQEQIKILDGEHKQTTQLINGLIKERNKNIKQLRKQLK